MKTFKRHLIRHGMTEGNRKGLYIGSGTDIPLCDCLLYTSVSPFGAGVLPWN